MFRVGTVANLSSSETGSEKYIRIVRAILGGGVGRYNGLHGMMVDTLLNVTMVIATGDIILVPATENSDLIWGFRGAGISYGIIVSTPLGYSCNVITSLKQHLLIWIFFDQGADLVIRINVR